MDAGHSRRADPGGRKAPSPASCGAQRAGPRRLCVFLCPVQVRRRPAASPGPSARRSAPASTPSSAAATNTSRLCPRGSPRTSRSCECRAAAQAHPPDFQRVRSSGRGLLGLGQRRTLILAGAGPLPSLPSATGMGPPCLCQLLGPSLPSPLTTAAGMLLAAPSTWEVGRSLPGVSPASPWVSGRYPSSRARSGFVGTTVPIAVQGALHPTGMGDGSKSCVGGV